MSKHPIINKYLLIGVVCLLFLSLCPRHSLADEIRLKDGVVRKDVQLRMDQEGFLFLSPYDSRKLSWEDLDQVTFSLNETEGDFAVDLNLLIDQLKKNSPHVLNSHQMQEIMLLAWKTVGRKSNSIPDRDKQAFLDNLSPKEILEPVQLLREFLSRDEENSLESAVLQIFFGYRFIESDLPERFILGFEWIEEGIERLGLILQESDRMNQDWNRIFLMNRLYKKWYRDQPLFPEKSTDWYAEQLSKVGVELPNSSFPQSYQDISEAYIRQCHLWIRESNSENQKGLFRYRQKNLASGWVLAQKPDITKQEFYHQREWTIRWKQIRALTDIVYLTAEAKLFRRIKKRFNPQ